ncbi:hypothetical protein LTR85_003856 [Meristemomyces frigidus]|nr:hypothetical protein LTR85_003856 [Meristemomyces frigidus]
MAMSFLNPLPRPGDGAYLSQQRSRRRGGGRKKLRSFLRQEPDEYGQDEAETFNGATNQLPSFLPPSAFQPTSREKRFAEPRTIADEKLLSTHDQDARAPPPPPPAVERQHKSFLLEPTTPEYTAEHQQADAHDSMASISTNKGLPPHLRTRPASAFSNHLDTVGNGEPTSATGSGGESIRERLASDFGVKVSDPQPAAVQSAAADSTSEHGGDASKPAFDSGVRTDGMLNGAAQEVKSQAGPSRTRAPSPKHRAWGGGCGGGRGGQATQRDARWPKNSDQKADPNRWVTNWGSEKSFGSSIDSAQADCGFGEGKTKRAPAGEGGFKLTDWNGGWAPAPIDWDVRPAFRDPTKLPQIERWMLQINEEMCGITREVSTKEATADTDEVIPRYWIPIAFPRNVEQGTSWAPQTFWNEIINSSPQPMHEGDLDGVRPWWEQAKAPDSIFLRPYTPPVIKGIDPDENQNERFARENDHGADQHAQNRKRTELAKRDAQRKRREKQDEKVRKFASSAPVTNRERIKPGVNLYVRSARPADMVQLRDIYNHYVEFTCCTPEAERRTTSDMNQRYNDILSNRLPFLVACERGGKVPNRRKKRNPEGDLIIPDKVVGFAFADDYNDMTGMYRFTAEVEVYTSKHHYMKGIAKCLMDKLTALLDPEYVERGGFDVQGEELEGVGPSRVIKNIIANVSYDTPERLEWKSRWLTSWLAFEHKGNLEDIGNKLGKSVSLAVFLRKTGATVDAANPPISTGYPL